MSAFDAVRKIKGAHNLKNKGLLNENYTDIVVEYRNNPVENHTIRLKKKKKTKFPSKGFFQGKISISLSQAPKLVPIVVHEDPPSFSKKKKKVRSTIQKPVQSASNNFQTTQNNNDNLQTIPDVFNMSGSTLNNPSIGRTLKGFDAPSINQNQETNSNFFRNKDDYSTINYSSLQILPAKKVVKVKEDPLTSGRNKKFLPEKPPVFNKSNVTFLSYQRRPRMPLYHYQRKSFSSILKAVKASAPQSIDSKQNSDKLVCPSSESRKYSNRVQSSQIDRNKVISSIKEKYLWYIEYNLYKTRENFIKNHISESRGNREQIRREYDPLSKV